MYPYGLFKKVWYSLKSFEILSQANRNCMKKMTKKIVWRLKDKPTAADVSQLVGSGLLAKEEARQILFSEEDEITRDVKSLQEEIMFLRKLVEKMSESKTQIITTIKEIEVPYRRYGWYAPYESWYYDTGGESVTLCSSGVLENFVGSGNTGDSSWGFVNIKTF